MLASAGLKSGDRVELSGWLVETNDGLYILGITTLRIITTHVGCG